jgi:Rrf2 family cysteine metabolism transcriptional repressor
MLSLNPIELVGIMNFSAKTEYAVLALLYLTCHGQDGPVTVHKMAEELDIPYRFLEQIISLLKHAGLVHSVRGAHGGYLLARDPKQINFGEILVLTEGPVAPWACVAGDDHFACSFEPTCAVRGVWQQVQHSIYQILNNTTLQDLCDKTKAVRHRVVTISNPVHEEPAAVAAQPIQIEEAVE